MPKSPARHGALWSRQDFATIRKLVRAGMPARKIAKALGRTLASLYMKASNEGISLAAAKSRLLRGRHELKERLEKYYGGLGAAALTS